MASAGTPYRLVPAHFYPWRKGRGKGDGREKREERGD